MAVAVTGVTTALAAAACSGARMDGCIWALVGDGTAAICVAPMTGVDKGARAGVGTGTFTETVAGEEATTWAGQFTTIGAGALMGAIVGAVGT